MAFPRRGDVFQQAEIDDGVAGADESIAAGVTEAIA